MALRTDIEKALDELISNEEGMRFQGLAVVLAKQKWPELVASERKNDLGLDAHMPSLLALDGKGKGFACSITAELGKIKADIKRFRTHYDDLKILIYSTPGKITNETAMKWAETIYKEYSIELIVISREDIITDLMLPSNSSICRNHLGIRIPVEPSVTELLEKAQLATSEVVKAWLAHPRFAERHKILLQAVKLDQEERETGEVFDLNSLHVALRESRRIVLEAPSGRGKTTTLVQLAERHGQQAELAFLVDLPGWMMSSDDLLEFIARMPAFRGRGMHAEDLARLSTDVHCSFLLNGWNEVSENHSEKAVRALVDLERNFPRAGIIVATRAHHIRPPLPGGVRMKLLSLTRAQRTDYLQQRLANRASALIAQLDADSVLDDLTRTPLILSEVTTIFLSGRPIPRTKIGVLAAVMELIEQSEEHRDHLQRAPLFGLSNDYLAQLAAQMTGAGETTIVQHRARSIIYSVSRRLRDEGQIVMLPEPATILTTLSAHHVLEHLAYPSPSFRFQHQQLQEFLAAVRLKHLLADLIHENNTESNRCFAREYVNRPAWSEPLQMIAEEIGDLTTESSGLVDAVSTGKCLIELALMVDLVFAADLSRLCGPRVWKEVQGALCQRLRAWYCNSDEYHRQCALAGMLASGSEDFMDILLPLLTSDDVQMRLRTYRAWGNFHVSSLGKDWRHVVQGWKEEYRANFISEVVQEHSMAHIAEVFAQSDPSPQVRKAALHALRWVGATDALCRVLTTLDDEMFQRALEDRVLDSIPVSLRARALCAYQTLLLRTVEPAARLRIRLSAAEVGEESPSEKIKEELTDWPSGRINDNVDWLLKSALEIVRKADPAWVSHWVAKHIVDGTLLGDHWKRFMSTLPEILTQELLEKISIEELDYSDADRIISVLANTGDAGLAGKVFLQMCKLRSEMEGHTDSTRETAAAIFRQLEDLYHAMAINAAVAGMLAHLSTSFNAVQYAVVIEVFGTIHQDNDLMSGLSEHLRQRLRLYLKNGVSFVLEQQDFIGELKMRLATALGRIGDPEDTDDLHCLIRADIERMRQGRAARLKGERSPLAEGAGICWSDWHLRAVTSLDPRHAEHTLLELLPEPEYQQEATAALLRLARTDNQGKLGFKKPDYRIVWEARAGRHTRRFDEDRRIRYTVAIKQQISMIAELRAKSDQPDSFNGRLKGLARILAVLDGRESGELIIGIMALPGQWDGSTRVDALEELLFSGAHLPAETVDSVLNPTINHIRSTALHDQQGIYLLQRCLCLLPFVEPPGNGIVRVREIIADTRLRGYQLRELVTALGHSRCNDAVGFLVDVATTDKNALKGFAGEWIDALANLNTPESKRILLSFGDSDIDSLNVVHTFEYYDHERLALRIADITRSEPTVRIRLYVLCGRQLPPAIRSLLAAVISHLNNQDALLAGLNLVEDLANPPIPYGLMRGLEGLFVERRPHGNAGDTYTLEPRSANEIRSRLFEMVLNNGMRKQSAWKLLGQIELWRLEYGRPNSEPRHPDFDSGAPWPLIDVTGNIASPPDGGF